MLATVRQVAYVLGLDMPAAAAQLAAYSYDADAAIQAQLGAARSASGALLHAVAARSRYRQYLHACICRLGHVPCSVSHVPVFTRLAQDLLQ